MVSNLTNFHLADSTTTPITFFCKNILCGDITREPGVRFIFVSCSATFEDIYHDVNKLQPLYMNVIQLSFKLSDSLVVVPLVLQIKMFYHQKDLVWRSFEHSCLPTMTPLKARPAKCISARIIILLARPFPTWKRPEGFTIPFGGKLFTDFR